MTDSLPKLLAAAVLGLAAGILLLVGRHFMQVRASAGDDATAAEIKTSDRNDAAERSGKAVPNARATLTETIALLDGYGSVAARIRERIEFSGTRLEGSGIYLQGPARENLFRLEVKMEVAGRITSVQQVSDGETLWISEQLVDSTSLKRIDLGKILAARSSGQADSPTTSVATLALGGLPRLLRSLDESFAFAAPVEKELGESRVWLLRGRWRKKKLVELLPGQRDAIEKGASADLSALPWQLPDEALIVLGRDDLFPYRIELRRRHPPAAGARRAKTAIGLTSLRIDLFDVRIDERLDRRQFQFQPGNADFHDATAEYAGR